MTFGSLFSGIGGLDLGFELVGMRCVWQVEIDEYCRKVLAKHWPEVPKHGDIKTFDPTKFEKPDCIAGGFPCQDLSVAGKQAGLKGKRSGLWWEFARVIRLVRPRFVVVENVPGLLASKEKEEQAAIGCVLGELASIGYDAEWQSIPAFAFGSTQERYRVFIVAYPHEQRPLHLIFNASKPCGDRANNGIPFGTDCDDANPDRPRLAVRVGVGRDDAEELSTSQRGDSAHAPADANTGGVCGGERGPGRVDPLHEVRETTGQDHGEFERSVSGQGAAEVCEQSRERWPSSEPDRRDSPFVGQGWWSAEPPVVRMVYGVPRRLVRDRIRGLGNCVIPQVAEFVGRCLVQLNNNTQS